MSEAKSWEDPGRKVDLYFGVENHELRLVAQTLARSGFEWADIQRLMGSVWSVAYYEGYADRDDEGGYE